MYFRECIPKGGTIKTIHFLTGELRNYGVAHIRLRRLPLAASLSFESETVWTVIFKWLNGPVIQPIDDYLAKVKVIRDLARLHKTSNYVIPAFETVS